MHIKIKKGEWTIVNNSVDIQYQIIPEGKVGIEPILVGNLVHVKSAGYVLEGEESIVVIPEEWIEVDYRSLTTEKDKMINTENLEKMGWVIINGLKPNIMPRLVSHYHISVIILHVGDNFFEIPPGLWGYRLPQAYKNNIWQPDKFWQNDIFINNAGKLANNGHDPYKDCPVCYVRLKFRDNSCWWVHASIQGIKECLEKRYDSEDKLEIDTKQNMAIIYIPKEDRSAWIGHGGNIAKEIAQALGVGYAYIK